jgi:DNA-binding MarR family transcriptional regulator
VRSDTVDDPSIQALLRAYLDAVTLSEPLQGRIWAASQLTLTQVRALRRLAREPKPLGELGAELGLAPPSVTRVIDRLEERGLIERRRDASDRRRVVAAILPAGLRLVTSVPLLEASAIRQAAERIAPADRARIARALIEFAEAVRAVEQAGAQPEPVRVS